MDGYVLTEMTWPEVEQALKTVKLAIIPIGAHEQHGPHMTENCDAVLASEMAKRLAQRLYPHVIVTPTVNMGVSLHHIHFPGTITLQPDTLIRVLKDMVWSMKQHGIDNFLFLNSHGGNQSTLSVASMQIGHELNVRIFVAKTTASAKEAMKKHVGSKLFGHSCEREVSEAMYLAPHIIRRDKLEKGDIQEGDWRLLRPGNALQGNYFYEEMTRNGCIGDATKASYEAGQEIVEEAIDQIGKSIRQILNLDQQRLS